MTIVPDLCTKAEANHLGGKDNIFAHAIVDVIRTARIRARVTIRISPGRAIRVGAVQNPLR